MKLFTVPKIPMYCEGITHRLETRKSGEVKVVDLALRIAPMTTQLTAALDQDEYGFVRRLLFKMNDASIVSELKSVELKTPADRQTLTCFASSDTTKASIALDQVKITKLRARKSKDDSGWTFYVNISFGPLSKTELEYVNAFYSEQRFVTFDEAEASLDFDDAREDQDDEDEKPAPRPPLDFETATDGRPLEARAQEPARQLPPRHATKKPH